MDPSQRGAKCCFQLETLYHFYKTLFLFLCRNDRDVAQDQLKSCSAHHAAAFPRGVQLLPSLVDPAWGVSTVLHSGAELDAEHEHKKVWKEKENL